MRCLFPLSWISLCKLWYCQIIVWKLCVCQCYIWHIGDIFDVLIWLNQMASCETVEFTKWFLAEYCDGCEMYFMISLNSTGKNSQKPVNPSHFLASEKFRVGNHILLTLIIIFLWSDNFRNHILHPKMIKACMYID